MVLLNPIFDVYITRINSTKYSAFAASEKAKRPLQNFFKDNDFVHSLGKDTHKALTSYCTRKKLKTYFNDTVLHRDERFKVE